MIAPKDLIRSGKKPAEYTIAAAWNK